MIKSFRAAALATTALTAAAFTAGAASAQSTGTLAAEATVDEVVVTGTRGPREIDGAIVAVEAPKSRVQLTQEFIQTAVPGQSILDTINLLPSVTFTNSDAFGSAGGDITVRGFDSQRVALLFDGIPLNDSGNYEIYPNQQLDPELIESVTVNLGTTDVDSPTAAAAGGTINYVTVRPREDMGVQLVVSGGSEDFVRGFVKFDTGAVGPFGTTAFASIARAENSIFNGPGEIEKTQYNARIYQTLGGRNDFASLAVNYNENRNTFIDQITLAEFNAGNEGGNTTETCRRQVPVAGTAQSDGGAGSPALPAAPFGRGGCAYSAINPSNTGNIRGQFSYGLTDQLRLTIDPSFQYTLANGGGVQAFSETDAQLRGNSAAAGVDLNGDGDFLDSVRLYRPNTTNTRRYGVSTSLIWQFAENQSARIAYTYDRARHRQTGDAGYVSLSGEPANVFGGKDGEGDQVVLPDGSNLRRRDRFSIATLNQVSAEYRARFLDERLLLNVGVRAPFFERNLNNFCFQRDTFNAYCTTQVGADVDADGLVTFPVSALNPSAANEYGGPVRFEREYDELLPSLGVSYDLTDSQSVYVSYGRTISVPRTDDLYDRVPANPDPEIADAFDVGYRFQSGTFIAAAALWYNKFDNRIERALDQENDIATSINVGSVELMGIDGQIGFEPIENLTVYASASYTDTEVQDSLIPFRTGTPPVVSFYPTAGKKLPDVAEYQAALRVAYEFGPFRIGAQYKYTGERFANLLNTEEAPSYQLVDADFRVSLAGIDDLLENTFLQINVKNVFDEEYLGNISQGTPTGNSPTFSTANYQPGFPRAVILSLSTEF